MVKLSLNEISANQLGGWGGVLLRPPPPLSTAQPVFVNLEGAQESIPSLARKATLAGEFDSFELIPGLLERSQIRALASGQIFKDDVKGFSSTSDICLMSEYHC